MKKSFVYRGKKISSVGFFGLGKSNIALFEYLSKNYEGLSFTLRSDKAVDTSIAFDRTLFTIEAREEINEDIIFFSPSARRDCEEFLSAEKRGVILSSDVEFFFDVKTFPAITVTGTDGKSTTAALVSAIMSEKNDFPASANIGLNRASRER